MEEFNLYVGFKYIMYCIVCIVDGEIVNFDVLLLFIMLIFCDL